MTSPSDVAPVSEFSAPAFSPAPITLAPSEDQGAADLHQEINARRARVENAELLQHLRGL